MVFLFWPASACLVLSLLMRLDKETKSCAIRSELSSRRTFIAHLRPWNRVRVGLREDEVMKMTVIDVGLLGVSFLIFAYLMYALINPEKF